MDEVIEVGLEERTDGILRELTGVDSWAGINDKANYIL